MCHVFLELDHQETLVYYFNDQHILKGLGSRQKNHSTHLNLYLLYKTKWFFPSSICKSIEEDENMFLTFTHWWLAYDVTPQRWETLVCYSRFDIFRSKYLFSDLQNFTSITQLYLQTKIYTQEKIHKIHIKHKSHVFSPKQLLSPITLLQTWSQDVKIWNPLTHTVKLSWHACKAPTS